jgi:hypothetical protein
VSSRSHDAEDTEEVSKVKPTKVGNGHHATSKRGSSLDKETDKLILNDLVRKGKGSSSNGGAFRAEENASATSVADELKTNRITCASNKRDGTLATKRQQGWL